MPLFTNTTEAPIHVGRVMIVPGASADIEGSEPMLATPGFKALLAAGALHPGPLTEAEKADLVAQEAALAERLAKEGKGPNGKPLPAAKA